MHLEGIKEDGKKQIYNYTRFIKKSKLIAKLIRDIDPKEKVKVISHLDADGISAASIIIKTLKELNIRYTISVLQQLNKQNIRQLKKEKYNYLIFTDLGSSSLDYINNFLKEKQVFILDHHHVRLTSEISENIYHLNPFDFELDGDSCISGSGVTFIMSKQIDKKFEKLAHLALIGAVGDMQDKPSGLRNLNKKILKIARKHNLIEVKKGLKIFGSYTRPIHKALQYSTELLIPHVTGSETGSLNFLRSIGIRLKNSNNKWRTLNDLDKKEIEILITSIILQKDITTKPENILGDIIILKNETENVLKDIREYATLLNACGRLNKPALGLGTCLNQKALKKRALDNLISYRKLILNSLKWFRENKTNKEFIFDKNNYIIINAKYNIISTIIGTISSILSHSDLKNKIILSLAYKKDNTAKVSIRYNSEDKDHDINVKEIMEKIIYNVKNKMTKRAIEEYDLDCGGHKAAAGAYIPLEVVSKFIKEAKEVLEKFTSEERVLN